MNISLKKWRKLDRLNWEIKQIKAQFFVGEQSLKDDLKLADESYHKLCADKASNDKDYLELSAVNAKLFAENDKLKRTIAKELHENDGLGMEFTYVAILKDQLALAVEALEFIANHQCFAYRDKDGGPDKKCISRDRNLRILRAKETLIKLIGEVKSEK